MMIDGAGKSTDRSGTRLSWTFPLSRHGLIRIVVECVLVHQSLLNDLPPKGYIHGVIRRRYICWVWGLETLQQRSTVLHTLSTSFFFWHIVEGKTFFFLILFILLLLTRAINSCLLIGLMRLKECFWQPSYTLICWLYYSIITALLQHSLFVRSSVPTYYDFWGLPASNSGSGPIPAESRGALGWESDSADVMWPRVWAAFVSITYG